MKKILILLIALLLVACKGNDIKEDPSINEDPNIEVNNKETNFPFSDLEGYWVAKDGSAYFRVYKYEQTDNYVFEEGNFTNYASGLMSIISIEEINEYNYYFEIKYDTIGNLMGERNIDITDLEMSYINIDGVRYVYVGDDYNMALIAKDGFLANKYLSQLAGYWNSDNSNDFVYFGYEMEGYYYFVPGLYDSEASGRLQIENIEELGSNRINVNYWYEPNDYHNSIEIDLSDVLNGKIIYNNMNMHFVGDDFETAYDDYQKQFKQ